MYFHVYLIYRFTRTFTDHSSVITRCWGFELQNGKLSLKSPQTLATQDFAPASFLSTPDKSHRKHQVFGGFSILSVQGPVSRLRERILILPESCLDGNEGGNHCHRELVRYLYCADAFDTLRAISVWQKQWCADMRWNETASRENGDAL